MKHFLLFYEVGETFVARRATFRRAHLERVWAAHDRGQLLLAGAFADPVDGAALLFRADSKSVPEAFAREDPYVVNGLVATWRVREWTTVAGPNAATPIRPDQT